MVTLRGARDLLILAYDDNITDDVEFLLLYDSNLLLEMISLIEIMKVSN